ncbi:glucose-6-phosphate isomerase [Robbsia andropogonis]|uniref:glucose-6-phosphate isomerase n=1 Tax=Robbsia andropogonis TaxID=28092 RepID=UPI003D213758
MSSLSSPSSLPPRPAVGSAQAAGTVTRQGGARRTSSKEFWALPVAQIVITLLLIVAHQGTLLEFAFPVMSVGIGAWFLKRYPVYYIGYSLWLWFVSSEIRRLTDFFHGTFNPTSPIQVAPLAVAMLSLFSLMRHGRFLGTKSGLPYLLMLAGTIYSFLVGIVTNGLFSATYAFSGWLYPILMALHAYSLSERFPQFQRMMMRTWLSGTIFMGIYGVIQYAIMPPWDALWMTLSGLTSSLGDPAPFASRMFGPLNSTGPFAGMISAGLLLSLVPGYKWRWLTASLGVICLGLTLVRSAWGGMVLSILLLLTVLDAKTKIRVIFGVLIVAMLSVPVFTSSLVSDQLSKRVNTVGDISSDNSFEARTQFYSSFLSTALGDVAGQGMGAVGTGARLSGGSDGNAALTASFDSGVMELPYTLGWPGVLLFLIGLFSSLARATRLAIKYRQDRFVMVWYAIAIGVLAQLVFVNTLVALDGLLYMTGVTIPLMAARYYERRRALPQVGVQGGTPTPDASRRTGASAERAAPPPSANPAPRAVTTRRSEPTPPAEPVRRTGTGVIVNRGSRPIGGVHQRIIGKKGAI